MGTPNKLLQSWESNGRDPSRLDATWESWNLLNTQDRQADYNKYLNYLDQHRIDIRFYTVYIPIIAAKYDATFQI